MHLVLSSSNCQPAPDRSQSSQGQCLAAKQTQRRLGFPTTGWSYIAALKILPAKEQDCDGTGTFGARGGGGCSGAGWARTGMRMRISNFGCTKLAMCGAEWRQKSREKWRGISGKHNYTSKAGRLCPLPSGWLDSAGKSPRHLEVKGGGEGVAVAKHEREGLKTRKACNWRGRLAPRALRSAPGSCTAASGRMSRPSACRDVHAYAVDPAVSIRSLRPPVDAMPTVALLMQGIPSGARGPPICCSLNGVHAHVLSWRSYRPKHRL